MAQSVDDLRGIEKIESKARAMFQRWGCAKVNLK